MKKLLLFLVLLSSINIVAANDAVELRSGILLDPISNSAMIMLPEGGIAAIDIATGDNKWASTETDKPLAINSGRLISQTQNSRSGQLALSYLGASNGQLIDSVEVELPLSVVASVVDGPGNSFSISAITSNAQSSLRWNYIGGTAQGIAPDDSNLENLFTSNTKSPTPGRTGLISLNFGAASAETGNQAVDLQPQNSNLEQTVLEGLEGRQFISQDNQHVLVSSRISTTGKAAYQWRIYTTSGNLLGEFNTTISFAPFAVIEGQILFIEPSNGAVVNGKLVEQPPTLRAIDLRSGQNSWQRSVRSLRYTGPLPV